ncbi:MAG: hypothetical protein AAFU67_06100, partial [Bacteroidota bacterium]
KDYPNFADDHHLYVFCANTYNYAPDWGVSRFIKTNHDLLKNKKVVAITLGAGSTESAQKKMEKLIRKKSANLLASKAYWLSRPNDESKPGENNVKVAIDMARKFGQEIGARIVSLDE